MSKALIELFTKTYGGEPQQVIPLKAHASERKIYRLIGKNGTVCGIENPYALENSAFIYFARHFLAHNLPVPKIIAVNDDTLSYLEEDLGDCTLFDFLINHRSDQDPFPVQVEELYGIGLGILSQFQVVAGTSIDYSHCFQVSEFGHSSMLWDMNYFLESFLTKTSIIFDRDKLKKEFELFATYLCEAPTHYFMYRDFQSRNIMVNDSKLSFIDFQGGRKGPLQYDVASLLYQSSARIPPEVRDRLCRKYIEELQMHLSISGDEFMRFLDRYILIRMMQVLGTYGRQGLEGGKEYFKQSIPYAVRTIREVAVREPIMKKLPEMSTVFKELIKYE